jgi:hypothetical protein
MNRLHILMTLLLAASVAAHGAEAAPGSCYPTNIAAPPLSRVVVAVIDETAFRDTAPARDFRESVIKAASVPGQRVVVLTFAGLARGQHLARVYDATTEAPVTDEEAMAGARIAPFRASQRCVRERLRLHLGKLAASLDGVLKAPSSATLQRSEILHFLHLAIADFNTGLPATVLIYSDGLQHSREMSFYAGGKQRRISAETELKSVQRPAPDSLERAAAGSNTRTQVLWFGLLVVEDPAQYADPQQIRELSKFWRTVMGLWGVSSVQIGPTLNNPKF